MTTEANVQRPTPNAQSRMGNLLRPIGIEETLLALRMRTQPWPVIEPEDWSILDLFLVGDIRQPRITPIPRIEDSASEPSALSAVKTSGGRP